MTTAVILNIVLGTAIFSAILGLAAWAIATAHHDHHAMFSGTSRRRRQHAHRRPSSPSRGQATQHFERGVSSIR